MPSVTRSDAQRQADKRYREKNAADINARQRERRKTTPRPRPKLEFVGVDGEGYTDDFGIHHYNMLLAGDQYVAHPDLSPLSTGECIRFLASLPKRKGLHYVSYFFNYDVTMILRDAILADPDKARYLVGQKPLAWNDDDDEYIPREYGELVLYTFDGVTYGIDFVPKKHISVARLVRTEPDGKKIFSHKTTVHDVSAFYQMSFADALAQFKVGTPEQIETIRDMKSQRADFTTDNFDEILKYSQLECVLLAQLVHKLADRFHEVHMSAYPYEGPGPVAGRLLAKHVTGQERMQLYSERVPDIAQLMALEAYYGGRFEIFAHGDIPGHVYEYDIHSAYPFAMTQLPCLEHCDFKRGIHSDLYVAEVTWDLRGSNRLIGPLPVRRKNGTIYYPLAGRGTYWSVELTDIPAENLTVHSAYSVIKKCKCVPFQFVPEMYDRRREMEAVTKGSGIALKLLLNSLYGKLAQRIGSAPHFVPIWASLITAITRAMVKDVATRKPLDCVMIATDAVFLLSQHKELDTGPGLGQWELEGGKPFDDFVCIMPGVYFNGDNTVVKTRGISKKTFKEFSHEIRAAANDHTWQTTVKVPAHGHYGIRQILARGNGALDLMGNWYDTERTINPAPHSKRNAGFEIWKDYAGIGWSLPYDGSPNVSSIPYKIENIAEFKNAIDLFDIEMENTDMEDDE